MAEEKMTFEGTELTVHWEKDTCTHSAICVKNLKRVFQPGTRPWIKTENATADEIKKVIDMCPSKALSYENKD